MLSTLKELGLTIRLEYAAFALKEPICCHYKDLKKLNTPLKT